MKKINILLALFAITCTAGAQGIRFESGTWKEVKEKAAQQKKLIYMDLYTTWCGPCKVMAAQIFPDPKAGTKYNGLFVNYKIDAEKGEGLELAKKYQVAGYPTNLYIDPQTEAVVYRVMGSADINDFLERADIAMLEQKDPMKWADYEQKFEKGNADKKFLESYLNKAERLSMPNDKALDVYVTKFAGSRPDDATLKFLMKHTHTLTNKSMPLLFENRERINKLYPEMPGYFSSWSKQLPYNTLEQAIAMKDETMLARISQGLEDYNISTGVASGLRYYRKQYYTGVKDDEKAWLAGMEEADYLSSLSIQEYEVMDKEAMPEIRASLIYQLKGMNVPEEKIESSIKTTLEQNPDMTKSATLSAAGSLNETAWKVFEHKRTDGQAVKQALKWSQKSLEMVKGSASWPLFADTYACLLYAGGDKAGAILKEEEAITQAEGLKMEEVTALQETLAKMKADKL